MTSLVTIQSSLNAGELSPSLLGRVDLDKYNHGCSTVRNFFPNYRGGVSSRAGLAYVGTCKQQYPIPPRDIPFQFSITQGFVLEFGEHYMRVKYRGAYVTEGTKSASVSASGVFTVTGHGYSVGDWIYDQGNTGFDNLTWIISSVPNANTFTVTDLFGNPITTATASTGGTVSRIYTVVAPYAAVDLPYLKYTQSADVMTLCCVNQDTNTEYPPYSLTRNSNTNWTFTADSFSSSIPAPTGLTATAQSSDIVSTWYSYVVTAVNDNTGEESVASLPVNIKNVDIAITLGSNIISWNSVPGATSYNIYAATPSYSVNPPVSSLYGFVGTSLGPGFTDTNITPDFTRVPPTHTDPFVRGSVTQVNPTAGGINYSQQTISYAVHTTTGSGFSGTPVVINGSLAGFIIYNHGKNYQPGDTITFSDSGGGVASGTMTFNSIPNDTDACFVNGVKFTFLNEPIPGPTGTNTYNTGLEGGNLELTIQQFANTLNALNISAISVATYLAVGNQLIVTYKDPGVVGNTFKLDAGSAPITVSGPTLTGGGTVGTGATATLSIGPESGTYPSVASYYSQRRVYAASLNNPDTYWMSQPGLYSNMDSSIPVTASDAITGTPWAQQVNGIQFLVPMPGGLVVLTGKGAWQINGGQNAAITPSNQTATPQAYNGCNGLVQPITVNYDIIYLQEKGSIFRDLSYNFFTNIYTGTDLTVLSSHLFTDYTMVQAAYAEEPYKIVWVVRNDGILLSLTYLKEQDVYAWARHDTNGLFVSVCSVTEPPVDAVYVITQRYVQGAWRYYSERMDDRIWNNVEDAFCVDSGLEYPQSYPDATLNISGTTGTVTLTASASVFSNTDVGRIVRAGNGKIEITGYTSGTVVTGTVLETVTETVPNDPNNLVVPILSGDWSISTPITVVNGLNHLEGLQVTGLADGSVFPTSTVTNGSITLPYPASQITVGLPYTCQVQTMYLDVPNQGGTIQNRRKNITSVGIRLEASRGLQIGSDQPDSSAYQNYPPVEWTDMDEIKERTMFVNAGTAVPLYTGDHYKNINSSWNVKGQIAIQQTYPLPANVLSLVAYTMTGDDR